MTLKLGMFLPQNFSYDPHGSLIETARAAEDTGPPKGPRAGFPGAWGKASPRASTFAGDVLCRRHEHDLTSIKVGVDRFGHACPAFRGDLP